MLREKTKFLGDDDLGVLSARHPVTRKPIEVSFAKDVSLNGDPKQEALDLPRKFSWYVRLRDMAKSELRECQHEEYNVEEDLYVEFKKKFDDDGVKTTETEIKTRVKAHPRMRVAYRARNEAEQRYQEAESVILMLIEKRTGLQIYAKLHAAEISVGMSD